MERHEKVNIGIGISGVILTIISSIIAYKSCTSNEEIAIKSGSFDKPSIQLGFGNFVFASPMDSDTIKLIYGATLQNKSFNLSFFPFSIGNSGQKNAEDIHLLIEYPKKASIAINDKNILLKGETPSVSKFKREFISQKDINIVNYQISQLNPGMKVVIDEPFLLHKTEIVTKLNLDSYLPKVIKVKYNILFSVSLIGKDLQTQKANFSIGCSDLQDLDKLINDNVQHIERTKKRKDFIFFILPEKNNIFSKKGFSVNEFDICKRCIYMAKIDDTSPKQDMILALYNNDNRLEKIKAYNEKNEIIKDIEVTK